MYRKFFKRLIDVTASAAVLILASPVLAAVAVLLHFFNEGAGVFFTQERPGLKGRPFRIVKFKTMNERRGPDGRLLPDKQRITRFGAFVRHSSLDELPQLWNVFVGDMSFIGPRPERKFYIDQIMERDPRYRYLYQIRPGVTSYATLYNGYTDTLEKMLRRLRYDLFYLEHRSWWFDFKILVKTFLNIAFGRKF